MTSHKDTGMKGWSTRRMFVGHYNVKPVGRKRRLEENSFHYIGLDKYLTLWNRQKCIFVFIMYMCIMYIYFSD